MSPGEALRGLGITAGLDPVLTGDLAARCERLGYHSIWSNDEPDDPGLEQVARYAAATSSIGLGVGVLPLSRHDPEGIAAAIERLGLDPERLWVGIGSGSLPSPVEAVRDAVGRLRDVLPTGTRIVVAAMRPRLCRLGGEVADGVLLNWMLPPQAERARGWVREAAEAAGRPAPLVASYVRTAVGDGARERVAAEEGRYRTINEGHRRHFAAMDVPLGSVGVAADGRSGAAAALDPYGSSLDLVIARVLAPPTPEALAAVADAAAPGPR